MQYIYIEGKFDIKNDNAIQRNKNKIVLSNKQNLIEINPLVLISKNELEKINCFKYKRQVFKVSTQDIKWSHNKVKYIINCAMCNKDILITEYFASKIFCSRKCQYESLATEYRGPSHRRNGQYIECKNCQKLNWVRQYRINAGKGKYCNRQCYLEHIRNNKIVSSKNFGHQPKFILYKQIRDRKNRVLRFRSSYEILFMLQYLDKNQLTWEYEPKRFVLKENKTYVPDFFIKEYNTFIEIKGYADEKFKIKLEEFKELYPDVNLLVLTQDVLQKDYDIDLSKKSIKAICSMYKIRTYTRKEYKKKKMK